MGDNTPKSYRPGASAQFVEEDVFRTIIPVPASEATPGPLNRLAGSAPYMKRLEALGLSANVTQRLATELTLFLAEEPLTSIQVATQLQAAARTTYRDFQILREAGLIEPTDTYGYYRVTRQG